MPQFCPGVPAYSIHPPCTMEDKGKPSESLSNDADRVFLLILDERHLTAQTLLQSVRQRLEDGPDAQSGDDQSSTRRNSSLFGSSKEKKAEKRKEIEWTKEVERVRTLLSEKQGVLEKLENRCRLFREAQANLNQTQDWTVGSKHFGITTYYRREEDNSLSLKLEGSVEDAPIFEQVAVLKEVDLHHTWAPFCSTSFTVADLDKLDLVGYFLMGVPAFGLSRDGCFRAIGCDNIVEDGTVLLAGQGVHDVPPDGMPPSDSYLSDDPIIEKLGIPPVPSRRGSGRMTIRKFEAIIHIVSPTSAKTKIVANVNPNIGFLPNTFIEFTMKHLTGVVLAKLQAASKNASKYPVTNCHARKMREEKEFYQTWLLEKFKNTCQSKGWKLPPVQAFQLSEEELKKEADRGHGPKPHRANTFAGRNYPSREDIVENLSGVSNPHSMQNHVNSVDDDAVSELSNMSSVWTNPLSNYFRESEQKAQYLKSQQIAEGRRIAIERLQPKELDPGKRDRLNELRRAKELRTRRGGPKINNLSTISSTKSTLPLVASNKLYGTTTLTRMALISALLVGLFVLLHSEYILLWLTIKFEAEDYWYMRLLHNICVLLYVTLCAVPHFMVCDLALLFAFDSLELGSKTGEKVKSFYSDKVRLGVAAGSLGIVAASVLKALFKLWSRTLVWSLVRGCQYIRASVEATFAMFTTPAFDYLPDQLRVVMATCSPHVGKMITFSSFVEKIGRKLFFSCQDVSMRFLLPSMVTRGINRGVFLTKAILSEGTGNIKGYVSHSIDKFEGKISAGSWKMDVVTTSRCLFSYSAIFLVTTLVLFHLTTQKSKPLNKDLDLGTNESNVTALSEDSEGSVPTQVQTMMKKTQISAIPENSTPVTVSSPLSESRSFPPASRQKSAPAETKRASEFRHCINVSSLGSSDNFATVQHHLK